MKYKSPRERALGYISRLGNIKFEPTDVTVSYTSLSLNEKVEKHITVNWAFINFRDEIWVGNSDQSLSIPNYCEDEILSCDMDRVYKLIIKNGKEKMDI